MEQNSAETISYIELLQAKDLQAVKRVASYKEVDKTDYHKKGKRANSHERAFITCVELTPRGVVMRQMKATLFHGRRFDEICNTRWWQNRDTSDNN